MKLSQKRNCNRCRALIDLGRGRTKCELGIGVEPKKEIYGAVVEWEPCGECWKPITINDYRSAINFTSRARVVTDMTPLYNRLYGK